MAENIKLKDLYGAEQTYNGIDTVKIPKADGSGDATFVVPPTFMYMLKESSYSGTEENSVYAYSGAESEITVFGNNVQKDLYPNSLPIPAVNNYTFGDNNIYCHPLESMTITELMNRMLRVFSDDNVTVTPDTYSVTPGWFHIKYTKTGEGANIQVTITDFEEVADPSTVTFPAYLPWTINDANYFYSYIAEATQQVKAVTVTENGAQTINPDAGKSGLAAVSLNVNVPSSGGNLQEKEVSITSNGTTEVTPDEGYDGMSKVKAVVNVAGGGSSVQANWAQNDSTAADYIKNRPGGFSISVPSGGIPAKTYTFDGDVTGKEVVWLQGDASAGMGLVKVSDDIVWYAQVFGGTLTHAVAQDGNEETTTVVLNPSNNLIKSVYGVIELVEAGFIVQAPATIEGLSLSVGVWFLWVYQDGNKIYCKSLTTVEIAADHSSIVEPLSIQVLEGLVDNNQRGLYLYSESNKKFKVTVDDTGKLTATEVTN